MAILTAENERLAAENARLRAQLAPDAALTRAQTEQQMNALRRALAQELLDQHAEPGLLQLA